MIFLMGYSASQSPLNRYACRIYAFPLEPTA